MSSVERSRVLWRRIAGVALVTWLLLTAAGFSQGETPGQVDTSFNAGGTGPDGAARPAFAYPDGRILVVGPFSSYNGVNRPRLARLNADGSLDESFDPGSGANTGELGAATVLPDGKILVNGRFATFNGVQRQTLARLHPDGSVDLSFNANLSSGAVDRVLPQPDGKLIVAGSFVFPGETTARNLARLHADGTPDLSFQTTLSEVLSVTPLAIQPDGKILVGGRVREVESQLYGLFRLQPDGTVDRSFQPVAGAVGGSGAVCAAIQPDGKIIIGGNAFLRLEADGSEDTSFGAGSTIDYRFVNRIIVQADGKILIGGSASITGGPRYAACLRLNNDGTLDPGFTVNAVDIGEGVGAMVQDAAGRVVLGWSYSKSPTRLFGGEPALPGAGTARLSSSAYIVSESTGTAPIVIVRTGGNTDALTVDYSISAGTATAGSDFTGSQGTITFAPGETWKPIAVPLINDSAIEGSETFRVSLDGDVGEPATATVTILDDERPGRVEWRTTSAKVWEDEGKVTLQVSRSGETTGSIVVNCATVAGTAQTGSDFVAPPETISFADGENVKTVEVNINEDVLNEGSETFQLVLSSSSAGVTLGERTTATVTIADSDGPGIEAPGFTTGITTTVNDFSSYTASVVELPDGRLLVGGAFDTYNGVARRSLVRLNSDGSVDESFNHSLVPPARISQIVPQPDGKLILCGTFLRTGTGIRTDLVRLNADGTFDSTFNPGAQDGTIDRIALQPDGKLLVAGNFTAIGGGNRFYFARLLPTGSLDTTFTAASDPNTTNTLVLQPDGKILAGRNGLTRYHPNGETDLEFGTNVNQSIFTTSVNAVAVQPDGCILVSGKLRTIDHAEAMLVRLRPDGTLDPSFTVARGVGDRPSGYSGSTVAVQPDGHIIFSGAYDNIGGIPRPGIARLNSDGSVDLTFDTRTSAPLRAMLSNGDLIVTVSVSFQQQLKRLAGGQIDIAGAGALSFSWSELSVNEAAGEAVLNITRENGNESAVSVNFFTSDGTAVAGADYTASSGTVYFAAREAVRQVRIPIIDNATPEGSRRFTVQLSTPVGGAALGGRSVATVTIVDSERPGRFQLSAPSYLVRESASSSPVKITRTLGTDGPVSVRLTTADGTATAGQDYTAVVTTVVFQTGETEKTVSIPVRKDGLVEGQETFTVTLSSPTSGAELSPVAGATSSTVEIIDIDDPGSLDEAFTPALASGAIIREAVLQPDGKVVIAGSFTTTGTIRRNIARLALNGAIDPSFNAPSLDGGIQVILLQPDGKLVIAGAFTRVGATDRPGIARLNENGSLDLSFDPPRMGGQLIRALGLQSDGKIILGGSFQSVGDTSQQYVARLEADGSLDLSYLPSITSSPVGINALIVTPDDQVIYHASRQNRLVRLLTDGTVDPAFNTTLQASTGDAIIDALHSDYQGRILMAGSFNRVNNVPRKYIARLLPDGGIDASFNAGDFLKRGHQQIAVQADGRILLAGYNQLTDYPGVIRLMPDGTYDTSFRPLARAMDNTTSLVILPNKTVLATGITALDGASVNGIGRLLLGPQTGGVRLTATAAEVSENAGELSVTVERFGGSDGELTVRYETSPDTAQPGTDYTAVEGVLTFGDGVTSLSFTVPLLNDNTWEFPESFSIHLLETAPNNSYIPMGGETLTVTVNDDDTRLPGELQFAAVDVQTVESEGYARVTVQRVGGSDDVVEVKYATVDGTALAGLDYVAVSGILRFEHGQTSQEIEIPLLNNSLLESTENFAVRLSEPSGGAVLGVVPQANITILDGDDTSTLKTFRGAYRGLIHREEGLSGAITVSLAARGQATATLILDGRRYTFRGKFNTDGRFTATLRMRNGASLVLSLQLDVPGEITGRIVGTLETNGTVHDITADKAPYNTRTEPAPMAGRYTCVLESDPTDAAAPRGHGIGSVTVAKDGTLRFVGVLADGTKITQGTNLSSDGRWALVASRYAGKGGVSGIAQFTENGVSWDFAGSAYWSKAPRAKDRRYAEGIDTQLSIIGSPLPAKRASASLFGFSEATLSLVDGEAALDKDLTITPGDRFHIERSPERLKLSLNRSTGMITGTFIHPVSRRAVPIRAVVLPDEQRAVGFFLSPTLNGAVLLQER